MKRIYDPPEETVLKGPWQQKKNLNGATLTRFRAVWLSDLDEPIAREVRTDWERTDMWVEASIFTGTYLRLLQSKAGAEGPSGGSRA